MRLRNKRCGGTTGCGCPAAGVAFCGCPAVPELLALTDPVYGPQDLIYHAATAAWWGCKPVTTIGVAQCRWNVVEPTSQVTTRIAYRLRCQSNTFTFDIRYWGCYPYNAATPSSVCENAAYFPGYFRPMAKACAAGPPYFDPAENCLTGTQTSNCDDICGINIAPFSTSQGFPATGLFRLSGSCSPFSATFRGTDRTAYYPGTAPGFYGSVSRDFVISAP